MHAAAGAEVDDPVGAGDQIRAVLDDHHAVAALHQPAQRVVEQVDVGEVEAGRRLVEEEEALPLGRRAVEEARRA